MQTLNAREAARFLKIDVYTYYRGAAAGDIPAAKVGRSWVSIDTDLAQYLRAKYSSKTDSEGKPWGSTGGKAALTGGTNSTSRNARYEKALGQPTGRRPSKLKPDASVNCGSRPVSA